VDANEYWEIKKKVGQPCEAMAALILSGEDALARELAESLPHDELITLVLWLERLHAFGFVDSLQRQSGVEAQEAKQQVAEQLRVGAEPMSLGQAHDEIAVLILSGEDARARELAEGLQYDELIVLILLLERLYAMGSVSSFQQASGMEAEAARQFTINHFRTFAMVNSLGFGDPQTGTNQVELVVHMVTTVQYSGRSRPGSRRSGEAGTGFSSACA
jgi:hypothetical protein